MGIAEADRAVVAAAKIPVLAAALAAVAAGKIPAQTAVLAEAVLSVGTAVPAEFQAVAETATTAAAHIAGAAATSVHAIIPAIEAPRLITTARLLTTIAEDTLAPEAAIPITTATTIRAAVVTPVIMVIQVAAVVTPLIMVTQVAAAGSSVVDVTTAAAIAIAAVSVPIWAFAAMALDQGLAGDIIRATSATPAITRIIAIPLMTPAPNMITNTITTTCRHPNVEA